MFYFIVASLDCLKAPGASMLPTMGVSGDIVFVDLISPRFGKTVPRDIVIVRSPECPRKVITKRLIAQAGDSVTFLVDPKNSEQSKTVVVPKGHVWIQGDNIYDSRDSRAFGPVPYGLLYGKVFWRWHFAAYSQTDILYEMVIPHFTDQSEKRRKKYKYIPILHIATIYTFHWKYMLKYCNNLHISLEPVGEYHAKFVTNMGVLVRNIKITYNDWRKVPRGEKETIWKEAKITWKIKDDTNKKDVMKIMSKAFKEFRCTLTRIYITKTMKQKDGKAVGDTPVGKYDQITADVWEEFKKQRMDKSFLVKTLEGKGEFVPTRLEDALVKALGKAEHNGRTRGVGGFVGLQSYFGRPTSRNTNGKKYSEDEMQLLIEKVKKEAKEEFKRETMDEESVRCRLVVHVNEELTIVAEGMVLPLAEGKMVHNKPLTIENTHVSIDKVIRGDVPLPLPWTGFTMVGDAEGSFAQWPKSLILLEDKEVVYVFSLIIKVNSKTRKPKRKDKSKDTRESANKFQKQADVAKSVAKCWNASNLGKCPQQPNDFECGYYVMKWMYNITFYFLRSKEEDFEKFMAESTMSNGDIYEIKEEWATKCLETL
ncbi:hypothetical protein KSS87_010715 [Heliosperma pusillum]|nr:hypothetical protein KSS87_010715 [Heliosperma pusillum]